MITIFAIFCLTIGMWCIFRGYKSLVKDLIYWVEGVCFILLGFVFFTNSALIIAEQYKKPEFNPLYKIDPKPNYYLIESKNGKIEKVEFGKLEEYIENDNL